MDTFAWGCCQGGGEETYRSRRPSGPAAEASGNKRMLRKKAEVCIMKIFFEFGKETKGKV